MSFGLGLGLPFGGGPLEVVGETVSEVAGEPVTFDFSDEPNGPLPGGWEFYILTTMAGAVDVDPEPAPAVRFRVLDGLGLWNYLRQPTVGDPFQEQGAAASPSGILVGRNARATAILKAPTELLDLNSDAFFYEVTLGLRFDSDQYSYVGGRARAQWSSGAGWVEPLALEAVRAAGQAPVVLASASAGAGADPADIWRVSDQMELEVVLRGSTMQVTLSGVLLVEAAVTADGPAKVVLEIRAFNKTGGMISAVPTLRALQLQSLRDMERLGPIPQLLGAVDQEAPQVEGTHYLPLAEWLEGGLVKRMGSRQFEAVQDFDAEIFEVKLGLRIGDVVRAVEPYKGQALTASVIDLAAARGRG